MEIELYVLRRRPEPTVASTLGALFHAAMQRNGADDMNKDFNGFWYHGHDGSLTSHNGGYELVSQPLTPPWLRRELRKKHKSLSVWELIADHTCGIHIHINRNWLAVRKGRMVADFLDGMPNDVLQRWFGRGPNPYCKRGAGGRYRIINFTNPNTIEIRLFAGSVRVEWWLWCVDFTEYLVRNAGHVNEDAVNAYYEWWSTTHGDDPSPN
jgi:hypothetical protein